MKTKCLSALVALLPACALAAESLPPLPSIISLSSNSSVPPVPSLVTSIQPMIQHSKGNSFDLRFATVSYVVDFVYENAVKSPHVLGPDVLADQRQVSFRYRADDGDLRGFLSNFLDSLGYQVVTRDAVDFVEKKGDSELPKERREPFIYVPKYRRADYLMRMVQPLVGGRFTSQRGISASNLTTTTKGASTTGGELSESVPESSAAALIDQNTDQLVFLGTPAEIYTLRQVLPLIDVARGKVNLKATVYEVSDTTQKQSGFSLAVNILGLGLGINNGITNASQSVVSLHASRGGNSLDAAIQALDSDSRFKVLTRPNMTVLSGERARLNVGQQVPTQGQVSYQGTSGTPVQSIVYQDAGVIFDVQPTVMRDTIDVVIDEEISDFVNTTTGVNSSPTKNTRTMQTTTSLQDGDLVVIGGLVQTHDTRSTSGFSFLPHWMNGHNDSRDNTEIVLVLQVAKI